MERINDNSALTNISLDGVDSSPPPQSGGLEAYTVVLSAAAHLVSALFGGPSSAAILLAISTRPNIHRYSYTLVLSLLLACCGLNFLWSPLELADLVIFHHLHRHPCPGYLTARTTLYLFLVLFLALLIALLSVEGILRLRTCFGHLLKKVWPVVSSISALASAACITVVFIVKCVKSDDSVDADYILMDAHTHSFILALIAVAVSSVSLTLGILLALLLAKELYWEDGRPRWRQKSLKLEIPEFLISQSTACPDPDGSLVPSGTPSPSTPKLLLGVGDPETSSIKGEEDASQISDLPTATMVKSPGNRLGINMAQVLGRRRHTICQISDSSSGTAVSTQADPLVRAKQYNYVRKFSVDISALQAQLQNPKIFRDAPYQSDMDLSKKSPSPAQDHARSPAHRSLLPLKPLTAKLEEEKDSSSGGDHNQTRPEPIGVGGPRSPPPPVIMVSNDDTPQHTRLENESSQPVLNSKEACRPEEPSQDCNTFAQPQKPTSLTFSDSAAEERYSVPTLESAISDPSEAESSESRKMARLVLLLSLTFVLGMLPALVVAALKDRLSRNAFVNISTCTAALSAIQTIVYPHLIASYDSVVRSAIGKLKARLKRLLPCSGDADVVHSHTEESSSAGHA